LKVAFHSGHLNERGSDTALFDYADLCERLLGHTSVVLAPMGSDLTAADKFGARFKVYLYGSAEDRDAILRHERADVFYAIKYGHDDGVVSRVCRTVVHCAFELSAPHGDVYAAVSEWLADEWGGRFPWVPHVVALPDVAGDLRAELGIPPDALVLGRHGGVGEFNLPFVHEVVTEVAAARDDVWFVFLNTTPFCPPHPHIVHLPATVDLARKLRFLDTCDAMLHARAQGETFGLAVGEFSFRNKPVLTWRYSKDRAHVRILKEQCLTYADATELRHLIATLRTTLAAGLRWDAYRTQFAPDAVMRRFASVFLGA
jgi:hypothetical protein